MRHFELHRGHLPLLISAPHHGREIPAELQSRMHPAAQLSPDSDHHVADLYQFARELGASVLVPRWSRYVIDLNRPPSAAPLYPGQRETGLVPQISFAEQPLYRPGLEPDAAETAARIERYWQPYHHALLDELLRLRSRFPRVVLWDAHSIISECPMFFSGRLADLNLGTADGRSAAAPLTAKLSAVLAGQSRYTSVVNGRFKGGYITRHYGRPEVGLHGVQLELAQCNYMDEQAPFAWVAERAEPLIQVIRQLLLEALAWADPAEH